MKFLKSLIIISIFLTTPIKADLNENLLNQLRDGGKLIFIRHAYAPGGGDPDNFNLKDCSTQRNLNSQGRKQAKNIGEFFEKNNIKIEYVLSSGDAGVLVPAGVWSKQTYLDIGTSILVLCDRAYEVEDYIHDYKDYIAYVTNFGVTQQL